MLFTGYTAEAFSKTDLAYFTGFFEADGHCSFYRNSRGWAVNVAIEQKDGDILIQLRELFGGTVTLKDRQKIYVWHIHGHRAISLLKLIRPYLRTYRVEKIDRCVKFWETPLSNIEERLRLIAEDRAATELHRNRLSELAGETPMRQSSLGGVGNPEEQS